MKILVTGAAGFIGSHLSDALLARGDTVTGIDNFDSFYPREVKESNLASAFDQKAFTLVEGDIQQKEDLDQAFAGGIDLVVHLAARAGVRPSIEDPILYQAVNVNGTNQVLEAMRRHGCGKMVIASSSSVYGNNQKIPFSESDSVDHPISPYAATKKACELLCHTYHHLFDMDITNLRFFTVYGPRQRPDLAIHKFARLLAGHQAIQMFGDGLTSRDYTFITDILQGVMAAIDLCQGYRIYNLGESKPVPLKDMISTIARHLGVTPEIVCKPMQPGDVNHTFADISLAKTELGYCPSVSFDEGIGCFIDWYRKVNP